MVTKEMIKAELDRVPEDRFEKVYEAVKFYSRDTTPTNHGSLLSKLRTITIEGPKDFAANIDLYLTGEKGITNGTVG